MEGRIRGESLYVSAEHVCYDAGFVDGDNALLDADKYGSPQQQLRRKLFVIKRTNYNQLMLVALEGNKV